MTGWCCPRACGAGDRDARRHADLGGMVGKDRKSARKLMPGILNTLRARRRARAGWPSEPGGGFPFFDAATGSRWVKGSAWRPGWGLRRGSPKAIGGFMRSSATESRASQNWEAMDLIAERRLTSVVAIFNCNGQGQADYVSKQQSPEAAGRKGQAFRVAEP